MGTSLRRRKSLRKRGGPPACSMRWNATNSPGCSRRGTSCTAWSRAVSDGGLFDAGIRASTLDTLVGSMLLEGHVDKVLAVLPATGDPNDASYPELVGMRGLDSC